MVEYLANFLTNMAVKEFWKSVHICQSYDKKASVLFFETLCGGSVVRGPQTTVGWSKPAILVILVAMSGVQ